MDLKHDATTTNADNSDWLVGWLLAGLLPLLLLHLQAWSGNGLEVLSERAGCALRARHRAPHACLAGWGWLAGWLASWQWPVECQNGATLHLTKK